MKDPDEYERSAIEHAGTMAGEYLDSLGKTDLATMTREDWQALIAVVCGGYVEKLAEIADYFVHLADTMKVRTNGHPPII